MTAKGLIFTQNSGGLSTDEKVGIPHSFAGGYAFDFRKSPSKMSVLPGLTREDEGNCKDLIVNEVMIPNGTIIAYGNAGNIYKRTTSGVWSTEGKLSTGYFGEDYRKDSDSIYFAEAKTVSLYNPVSLNPSLTPDLYGPSYSTYDNTNAGFPYTVSAYQTNSQQRTQIGTTIIEGQATQRYFQSDIEPLNKISVFIAAKGTGDWTLTLHDGLNNVLGVSTVVNASLKNNTFNDFYFTAATNQQVRIYVAPNARTYHIHVTSTVGDGTVSSTSTNDLSSCDLEVWADRLVQTTNGLHPIARFLQYETFGNANYLSVWEPLSVPPTNDEWVRHRLVFPEEYEVCGLAVLNEYIAIACERIPSGASNAQGGIIFWWDGLSDTYNYFTDIPEGAPYAIRQYKNVVYYYAGGAWYAIAGSNSIPVKVRTMPGSDTEFSGAAAPINIYPYTATVRRGIHLMAYPSTTTNTDINYGVYSWGAVDKNYPDSFGYSYLLSTGSQNYSAQNNLTIGMVKNFGDTLHVSWRDDVNGGYGIDVVTNASNPAQTAIWESLISDGGYTAKLKTGGYIEAYYSIPDNTSLVLSYSIDRGAWIDSDPFTTDTLWQGQVGYARYDVDKSQGGRYHEIQMKITVTTTASTTPEIYMAAIIFQDNKEESIL